MPSGSGRSWQARRTAVLITCAVAALAITACERGRPVEPTHSPTGNWMSAVLEDRKVRLHAELGTFAFEGSFAEAVDTLTSEEGLGLIELQAPYPYPGQDYMGSEIRISAVDMPLWDILEKVGRQAGLEGPVLKGSSPHFILITFVRPPLSEEERALLPEHAGDAARRLVDLHIGMPFRDEKGYADALRCLLLCSPPPEAVGAVLAQAQHGDSRSEQACAEVLRGLFELYVGKPIWIEANVQPDYDLSSAAVEVARDMARGFLTPLLTADDAHLAGAARAALRSVNREPEAASILDGS